MKPQTPRPYRFPVWLATLIAYLLLSVTGILLSPYLPDRAMLWVIFFGLWVILAGVAALCLWRFKKKHTSMSVQDILDYGESQRANMLQDASTERKKLHAVALFCKIFWLVLFLLSMGTCFCASVSEVPFNAYLSYLLLCGHMARFLRTRPEPQNDDSLSPEEFPLLYALAKEAAGSQCDRPIYLHAGSPTGDEIANAAVGQDRKGIHIVLGPALVDILTKEELLQILRHEFAHIEGNHVEEMSEVLRLLSFLSDGDRKSFFTWATDWALSFPKVYLAFKSSYYFRLISHIKEKEADSIAAEKAAPPAMAGALAKTNIFSLFWYENSPGFIFGESEEIPQHWVSDILQRFRDLFPGRREVWEEMILKEIPSRADSHPTFPQRWEALGKPLYSTDLPAREDPFGMECRALVEQCDRELREIDGEKYQNIRQEAYLQHLQVVEDLSPRISELSPDELRPLISAYNQLGRISEAEAVCDKILGENNEFSGAFASYWKGCYLLLRHDPTGISYLYRAMDVNTNYVEPGLELIGNACIRLGLEEDLEEYRRRYAALMQTAIDHSTGGITAKADLSPESLPEGWLDMIMEKILSAGKDHLQQVYLVHETANDTYEVSSFVLRYKEGTESEIQAKIYTEVFDYLDDFPYDWEFALYEYTPSMEKPLAKVPGSCIYHC